MTLIRDHSEPPANRCPLVPVRMAVEVDVWPEPGEALPLEYEDRQLGAVDNRRLVGKVAQVLIDHIALPQQAAVRFRLQAKRDGSAETRQRADHYAMEVRELGRRALRGIDLDELARALQVETHGNQRPSPATESEPTERVEPQALVIKYVDDRLAIVTEGGTTVHVRGPRQVHVFRAVVEADGRDVSWAELVRADMAACGEELDRRWRGQAIRRRVRDEEDPDGESEADLLEPTTPRHAAREESLQRAGNRIRKALGKLDYHWHQSGHGARWDSEVS